MTTDPQQEPQDDQIASDDDIADCEAAVRQLYSFLDGELTEELRAAFETHLNACGPCVDIVTFKADLRHVIANRCQDHVPEELRLRIASAIFKEASNPG